ncbi:hypothetical protein GCM10020369_04480 [Cryptosporangium minutisporangium]|uniref:Uncharacterized protein n=1 Tax=Cryptosporangium minutisporangium TaxID=113569 RepID=A0ABP6SQW2_9ACTN
MWRSPRLGAEAATPTAAFTVNGDIHRGACLENGDAHPGTSPEAHAPPRRVPQDSALPRFRASALPRFRVPASPRFRVPASPRFRVPALPRFRVPALPRPRASAPPPCRHGEVLCSHAARSGKFRIRTRHAPGDSAAPPPACPAGAPCGGHCPAVVREHA